MSTRDAIPDDDARVVIPAHLRGILRHAAETKLQEACDVAFPPDRRDEVVDAVHVLDALEAEEVSVGLVTTLVRDAIAETDGERVEPHTIEAIRLNDRLSGVIRELVEFRDTLGGLEGPEAAGGGAR
ncbi:MAG TPA: hypothetical protein VFG42_11490 [Baekduia sp.]|uniref:hypothetical protein n=1 Tax=Baekduia sp. TaxID=2600305 RepID=UPI002D7A0BB0|nr:hypothetical protein [Baekduia sp.]HET6507401.1 hypothetical protein [Baekduia sp.]